MKGRSVRGREEGGDVRMNGGVDGNRHSRYTEYMFVHR